MKSKREKLRVRFENLSLKESEKKCVFCRVIQTLDNFQKRQHFSSRYKSICKNCEVKQEIRKKEREEKWEKSQPPQPFRGFWEHLEEAMFDNRSFTVEDILEYQKKGVDIHATHKFCGANALEYACEFRNKQIMQVLLQAGANVNNLSPLECVIAGHGAYWRYEYKHQEECIRLLLRYGAKPEISQSCKDEFITLNTDPKYEMPSPFLLEFFNKTVTLRN